VSLDQADLGRHGAQDQRERAGRLGHDLTLQQNPYQATVILSRPVFAGRLCVRIAFFWILHSES
jgi:hypothetical protein